LHKLKALQIAEPMEETKVVAVNEEEESEVEMNTVNLAIDHSTELLCFMTEISLDPGSPKTLREVLNGADTDQWQMAIAKEIMNFLSRNAWRKVPMSQVRDEGQKPIPTKPVFKIKDEQDGMRCYKAQIVTKGFLMVPEWTTPSLFHW